MLPIISISVLAALAQDRPAPDRKPEIREIKSTGCVARPPQTRCLLLKTLDGKTTYNIVSVDPTPEPGFVITIDAKPHSGSSDCNQGIAVDVSRWQSTGEKCAR
jgi:hypothetical protein